MLQFDHGVVHRQVDQGHGPLAKAAFMDFFVVQDFHVPVAGVGADASEQRIDAAAFALDDLKEKALALTQHTRDALCGVVGLRLRQDGVGHGAGLRANGAAHIEYAHVDAVTGHPHGV